MIAEDIAIEFSKLTREAHGKVAAKMASGQLGEAWVGLDDRRIHATIARGADRRARPQGELQEAA